MTSYLKRKAVSDPAEWVYQIDPAGFFVRDSKGDVSKAHWTDLVQLELGAAPVKDRPWRHLTVVIHRNGRRFEIDNTSAVSAAEFEDTSPQYAPFIRELFAEIEARAPYARVRRGHGVLGYWSIVGAIGLLLAVLVGLVIVVPVQGAPAVVSGLSKLALIALIIVPMWGWLAELRPRGVRISELPDGAYPRAERHAAPAPVAPMPVAGPVEVTAIPPPERAGRAEDQTLTTSPSAA